MFGTCYKKILEELRAQNSVRKTLERQIRRLEQQNKDLMNRLMARNFIDYVNSSVAMAPELPEVESSVYSEEELAGTIAEE